MFKDSAAALHMRSARVMGDGWTGEEAPFHAGERAAQERAGVREIAARIGGRFVRTWMPDEHRRFYQALPYLIAGALDERGDPWAHMLVGEPGFLSTPDEETLRIHHTGLAARPGFMPGGNLGLLGIELATRRRNRVNGWIEAMDDAGATIRVTQAFGNCPQFIQQRAHSVVKPQRAGAPVEVFDGVALSPEAARLARAADTFFVASAQAPHPSRDASGGVDVSHRGGPPGFVRLDGAVMTWPDFSGNNHFNTIGNLMAHPAAGFLFIDFATGDTLQLIGDAEVDWDSPDLARFAGAERLVRLHIRRAVWTPRGVPLRFALEEPSPSLARVGRWQPPRAAREDARVFIVRGLREESPSVRSLWLAPERGATPTFTPGQHVHAHIPDRDGASIVRSYSLSGDPEAGTLRLTVARHERGEGSRYMHSLGLGDTIRLSPPRGTFTLDAPADTRADAPASAPVVLLAGGVGITPLWSMLLALTRRDEDVFLIWSIRGEEELLFREALRALRRRMGARLRVHIQQTASAGRLDLATLTRVWPKHPARVYLCGSEGFARGMRALLDEAPEALPTARLTLEAFGSPTPTSRDNTDTSPGTSSPREVRIHGKEEALEWRGGDLLSLLERAGYDPPFSCRNGSCGTCAARVCAGAVEYPTSPLLRPEAGHALLCVARPAPEGVTLAHVEAS